MITLRVDEKALESVVSLAMQTNHLSRANKDAIKHVAKQASQGILDKIEQRLEIDVPDIYGVPI